MDEATTLESMRDRVAWRSPRPTRARRTSRDARQQLRVVEPHPEQHPISRRDSDGNTYQRRTLDDGSTHEVLKNFPICEQAFSMLGERAAERQWIQHEHYWILSYRLM